jgi:hypothetical protein
LAFGVLILENNNHLINTKMKLEQQVCSRELAEKLKKLGVKYTSLFIWMYISDNFEDNDEVVEEDRDFVLQEWDDDGGWVEPYYPAFTVAELGEMLPDEIEIGEESYWLYTGRGLNQSWDIGYRENGSIGISFIQNSDTEADARAKMLIYLIENNLLKVEDIN